MPLVKNILNRFGLTTKREAQIEIKKSVQRGIDAARTTRFRVGWTTRPEEVNRLIQSDLPTLRARTQDMLFNNAFVAAEDFDDRYFVIGPNGIDLQPQAKFPSGVLDDFANGVIKKAFDKWCKKQFCTVSRRHSFVMVQYLIRTMLRTDGEVILRQYTKGAAVKDNLFGYTLDFIDPNDIDHNYNMKIDDNTFIITGVQVDSFRRLQGIWIKKKNIQQELTVGYYSTMEREFIPADELIYGFDPKHFKQVHGITSLAAVLITLKDTDMWKFYSMQNAKGASAKMGFLKDTQPDSHPYTGDKLITEADSETSDGEGTGTEDFGKYMDMEAASIEELPWGKEFVPFDPKFPSDQHEPYMRSNLQEASYGSGKDYAVLTGDRQGESFASGRGGEMKAIGAIAYDQTITIENWLVDIYENWVKAALRTGALYPLVYGNLEKYLEHYWQGFKKGWLDPYKKALADQIDEQMGWKSKIDNQSERGRRPEDIIRDKATVKKLEVAAGVEFESLQKTQVAAPDPNQPDNTNPTDGQPKRNLENVIQLHEVSHA